MQPRLHSLVNLFEQGILHRRDDSEERRENERQERLTQILSAPNPAASAGTNTDLPTLSERRAPRRPVTQSSPQSSPIELPSSHLERHGRRSESFSNHNVRLSPEAPAAARVSVARTLAEDPPGLSTRPPTKDQAIQHLQAQLNDIRVKI